jgi:hypothetical protein
MHSAPITSKITTHLPPQRTLADSLSLTPIPIQPTQWESQHLQQRCGHLSTANSLIDTLSLDLRIISQQRYIQPWARSVHGTPIGSCEPTACPQRPHFDANCQVWNARVEIGPVSGFLGLLRQPGRTECRGRNWKGDFAWRFAHPSRAGTTRSLRHRQWKPRQERLHRPPRCSGQTNLAL